MLCEVAQNVATVSEQLDAANNNTRPIASSHKHSDAENNNLGPQSSPCRQSVSSGMSQDPVLASQDCPDDGIQIMPYADFVRSRMARGLAPPRGVVVRRSGRHTLVPQYVVQHQRQHRAHVRSLRRHGYESEDGRVAGRHQYSHGYDSDQHHGNASRHRHRRTAAAYGYESDIGYRSDLAGYNSSRPGPHRAAIYPYSSDLASRDRSYSSEQDVHRQKTQSSSSIAARPGHNTRDVRETITEEVMEFDGQPSEQSETLHVREWPSSVHTRVHNQFEVSPNFTCHYEAERRRSKSSSRRRNFEPIEL